MGKITWFQNGPFETGAWGGLKRVPWDDPRVINDPRAVAAKRSQDDEFGNMDDDMDELPLDDPTEGMDIEGELPNLGALIPRSDGARGREREGDTDTGRAVVPRGGNMADVAGGGTRRPDGEQPVTELARIGGATVGAGNVSKETQVMQNATPSYGLQETHTALCNYNGWFGATVLDHSSPLVSEFRMTAPFDMLASTLGTTAEGAGWTKQLTNVPYNGNVTRGGAGISATFPITTASGANATETANWFNFWSNIYEYYTVLSCDYEVVIACSNTTYSNDVLVGFDFNSYSDTAGATGNKTPQTASVVDMMSYKHIKWVRVEAPSSSTTSRPTAIISGRYVPGMANRNVSNDGDVKTWNSTGGAGPVQPTLKEFLTLYFYKHPMATSNTTTTFAGCNVQYTLKYKVQFKDLRVNARYPTTGVTDISMLTSSEVMQVN